MLVGKGKPWRVLPGGVSVLCELGRVRPTLVFQGKQEENDVVEKLNLFLDLLQSYRVSLGCSLPGVELLRVL